MGGLPILTGAVRHGAEVIVPLDASHFLAISTLDVGGDDIHAYLAATVEATSSSASDQTEAETIRREGVKLRAIGIFLGYWYKDQQHVYDFSGGVIPQADPATFVPMAHDGSNASFARDQTRVYDSTGAVIPGADPDTFKAANAWTAQDAHHVYDWSSGALKISILASPE